MDTDLTSIADILRARVSTSPDSPAMICERRPTTLRALDQRANQVAHGLRRSLPGPGGRAGILDTNSDLFFEILFGAAKANRVLVPLTASRRVRSRTLSTTRVSRCCSLDRSS